jgi:hypothetical protein
MLITKRNLNTDLLFLNYFMVLHGQSQFISSDIFLWWNSMDSSIRRESRLFRGLIGRLQNVYNVHCNSPCSANICVYIIVNTPCLLTVCFICNKFRSYSVVCMLTTQIKKQQNARTFQTLLTA